MAMALLNRPGFVPSTSPMFNYSVPLAFSGANSTGWTLDCSDPNEPFCSFEGNSSTKKFVSGDAVGLSFSFSPLRGNTGDQIQILASFNNSLASILCGTEVTISGNGNITTTVQPIKREGLSFTFPFNCSTNCDLNITLLSCTPFRFWGLILPGSEHLSEQNSQTFSIFSEGSESNSTLPFILHGNDSVDIRFNGSGVEVWGTIIDASDALYDVMLDNVSLGSFPKEPFPNITTPTVLFSVSNLDSRDHLIRMANRQNGSNSREILHINSIIALKNNKSDSQHTPTSDAPSPPPTSQTTSASANKFSTPTIVGIAIGGFIGLVLFLILVLLLRWYTHMRKRLHQYQRQHRRELSDISRELSMPRRIGASFVERSVGDPPMPLGMSSSRAGCTESGATGVPYPFTVDSENIHSIERGKGNVYNHSTVNGETQNKEGKFSSMSNTIITSTGSHSSPEVCDLREHGEYASHGSLQCDTGDNEDTYPHRVVSRSFSANMSQYKPLMSVYEGGGVNRGTPSSSWSFIAGPVLPPGKVHFTTNQDGDLVSDSHIETESRQGHDNRSAGYITPDSRQMTRCPLTGIAI